MGYWECLSKEDQEELIRKSLDLIKENVSCYGKMNPNFVQNPEGRSKLSYVNTWKWLEQEELYKKYGDIFDLSICGVIKAASEYEPQKNISFNPGTYIQDLICDGESNSGIKGVLRMNNWDELSKEERETLIFRWLPLIRTMTNFYGRRTHSPWLSPTVRADDKIDEKSKDKNYRKKLGRFSPIEKYQDIFNLAVLGVITAAREYKPEKGINFNPKNHIMRLILDGHPKKGFVGVLDPSPGKTNIEISFDFSGPSTIVDFEAAHVVLALKKRELIYEVAYDLQERLRRKPTVDEISEVIIDRYFNDIPASDRVHLLTRATAAIGSAQVMNITENISINKKMIMEISDVLRMKLEREPSTYDIAEEIIDRIPIKVTESALNQCREELIREIERILVFSITAIDECDFDRTPALIVESKYPETLDKLIGIFLTGMMKEAFYWKYRRRYRDSEELTNDQIAEVMQTTVATINVLLNQGKNILEMYGLIYEQGLTLREIIDRKIDEYRLELIEKGLPQDEISNKITRKIDEITMLSRKVQTSMSEYLDGVKNG